MHHCAHAVDLKGQLDTVPVTHRGCAHVLVDLRGQLGHLPVVPARVD